jgi:DNA-binding GntR family transcriptional regulator
VFDWGLAPMLRVSIHMRSDSEFQFTVSDAALDGWCVASLITEILEAYAARDSAGVRELVRNHISEAHEATVRLLAAARRPEEVA